MNNSVHIRCLIVQSSGTKDSSSNRLQKERATTTEQPKHSRNLRSSLINDLALSGSRLQISCANLFTVSKFGALFLNRYFIIIVKLIKTTNKVKVRVNVVVDQNFKNTTKKEFVSTLLKFVSLSVLLLLSQDNI